MLPFLKYYKLRFFMVSVTLKPCSRFVLFFTSASCYSAFLGLHNRAIVLPFWLRVYSAMPQKKVRVPTSGAFLNLGFSLRKFLYILYTSTGICLVSGSSVMFLHGV